MLFAKLSDSELVHAGGHVLHRLLQVLGVTLHQRLRDPTAPVLDTEEDSLASFLVLNLVSLWSERVLSGRFLFVSLCIRFLGCSHFASWVGLISTLLLSCSVVIFMLCSCCVPCCVLKKLLCYLTGYERTSVIRDSFQRNENRTANAR